MLRNHGGSREKLKRRHEGHLFPVIVKYPRPLLPSEEEDVMELHNNITFLRWS